MADTLRHKRPHLRCGLCDVEIEPNEETVYVDDERCHASCADEYHEADSSVDPYKPPQLYDLGRAA